MKGGRRGASVKTLKRMLKKAGLKVSGKKATLTRRAKKAHLQMGGGPDEVEGGRRRRKMRGGEGCGPGEVEGLDGTCGPASGGRRRRGSRKH